MKNLYMRPWHGLNVDMGNAINHEFDPEKFYKESEFDGGPIGIWSIKGDRMLKFLNKDWLEYIADTIFPVGSLLMFYRQPYLIYPEVHTDIHYFTNKPHPFSLNFVFSPDDDSFMTWYDVPNETGTVAITPADTKYLYWSLDEVEDKELDRVTIGNQLTLVRTSIPHNVIVNKQPRWMISLRFSKIPEIVDWNSAVDFFSKFMVNK